MILQAKLDYDEAPIFFVPTTGHDFKGNYPIVDNSIQWAHRVLYRSSSMEIRMIASMFT